MGEKITLNEKNLNIKVSHNTVTGEWVATWGTFHTVTAYSAASALRRLADLFEEKSMHGSAEETMRQYAKKPDIFCKYCNAPIFFGVLSSGKYLAFDTEPIDGKHLADTDRAAIFPRTQHTSRGPKPLAVFRWGSQASGPVYIPHPQTCGDTVTGPTTLALQQRWENNRIVSAEKLEGVVRGLRRIKADIAKGELDDPNEYEPHRRGSRNFGT